MADDSQYTPDQIETMRSEVAAYDAQKAAEEAAAFDAKMKPARDLVASEAFTTVINGLAALVQSGAYADMPQVTVHLDAANQILPNLRGAVAA